MRTTKRVLTGCEEGEAKTIPMIRAFACLFLATLLAVADSASRAEPVYKDRERVGAPSRQGFREGAFEALPGSRRPARRVMEGPDYAGSPWGLGKPSFWGIGPRPDDGW